MSTATTENRNLSTMNHLTTSDNPHVTTCSTLWNTSFHPMEHFIPSYGTITFKARNNETDTD